MKYAFASAVSAPDMGTVAPVLPRAVVWAIAAAGVNSAVARPRVMARLEVSIDSVIKASKNIVCAGHSV